jgi:hypothetical protein
MYACPKRKEIAAMYKNSKPTALIAAHNTTYIDSGASQHMFNQKDAFEDMSPTRAQINCAGTEQLKATHVGTIELGASETLHDVLYVPDLKHNLMSVCAVTKGGKNVMFKTDGTVVTIDKHDTTRQIGREVNGLYHLTSPNALVAARGSASEQFTLWHRRFGHPGRNTVMSLHKCVLGLEDIKFIPPERTCEGCVQAKSHRQPFGTATNRSREVLGRIHTDLCGPLSVPSVGNARYFLTFIDDATRFITVYPLARKDETFERFVMFKTLIEKQTGKSIKILHSDGGGEYINTDMRTYLSTHGIRHETTTAEMPQQNGVAERFNRTLMESLRAMMLSAGVP